MRQRQTVNMAHGSVGKTPERSGPALELNYCRPYSDSSWQLLCQKTAPIFLEVPSNTGYILQFTPFNAVRSVALSRVKQEENFKQRVVNNKCRVQVTICQ